MKLGKGVPSVWPGYVAAVASLVLSLLLLLAILVFAMTQVQNMVAKYESQILQAALQDDIEHVTPKTEAPPAEIRPVTRQVAAAPASQFMPSAPKPIYDKTKLSQLRLIFELGVADMPPETAKEVTQALQRMHTSAGVQWRISATTLVTDPVMEKNTYRLMLLVRDLLLKQNFKNNKIEISLSKSSQAPAGYERGEIVILIEMIEAPSALETTR